MAEKLYKLPGGRMVTRAEYPHADVAANRAANAARAAAVAVPQHMQGINSIGKQPTFGKRTQPPASKGHNSSRTLEADTTGSTCFDALTYRNGTVTADFTDGSSYSYDMTRSEAMEWFDDDSLGGYFNDIVR